MSARRRDNRTGRRLRRIAVLPSLVTLLNAVCGFTAIHFTARGMNEPDRLWLERPELTFFAAAAWLIFLAMVADSLDGWLARMSRSASSFGGQLDSLADVISFGVAPAFLMLRVVESSLGEVIGTASPAFGSLPGKLLWLVAAMYICCTALRLARFNVENAPDDSAHLSFSGLPSPAAAGVVASLILLHHDICRELAGSSVSSVAQVASTIIVHSLPFVVFFVALLMVSNIRYPHLLNRYVRGRRPFSYVVYTFLVLLILVWQLQLALVVSFVGYAATGSVRWLWLRYQRRGAVTPG